MGLEPTTQRLFRELDELRILACLSIRDVSAACGVTPRAYKLWRAGVVPGARREEILRVVGEAIRNLLETREFPLGGKAHHISLRRRFLLKCAMQEVKEFYDAQNP